MLTQREAKVDLVQRVSSKIIALVILLIALVFSYGCDRIDTLRAYEDTKKVAVDSPVIRYPDNDACFIYVDKNSNVHSRCYGYFDVMELHSDKILFNYNEYMKMKNANK